MRKSGLARSVDGETNAVLYVPSHDMNIIKLIESIGFPVSVENIGKDGKGRSLKANDYRIAALCFTCHAELDQGHKLSREERLNMWEAAHRGTIGWLFENNHITVPSS